jgi:hypothetical protein
MTGFLIGSEEDLWAYLEGPFVDQFYPDYFISGWLDQHNRLVGGIKLYQQCDELSCEGKLDEFWYDLVAGVDNTAARSCYHYQPSRNHSSYDSALILPGDNRTAAVHAIQALQQASWVDGATSSVLIEHAIGNGSEEFLQLARLRVEFAFTGALEPSSDFTVIPAGSVGPATRTDGLAVAVAFIIIILIFEEIEEFVIAGSFLNYCAGGWNLFEVVTSILTLAWFGIIVHARGVSAIASLEMFDRNGGSHFLDLWDVRLLYLRGEETPDTVAEETPDPVADIAEEASPDVENVPVDQNAPVAVEEEAITTAVEVAEEVDNEEDECPLNAHMTEDGCQCDFGFDVNEESTGCESVCPLNAQPDENGDYECSDGFEPMMTRAPIMSKPSEGYSSPRH